MSDAPVSPERIAELKALAAKATPGPWWFDPEEYDGVLSNFREIVSGNVIAGTARPICHPATDDDANELPFNDDAAFIAAANPETVTALCERIAMLEAERNDLLNAIDNAAGQTTDEMCRDALCDVLHRYGRVLVPGPAPAPATDQGGAAK